MHRHTEAYVLLVVHVDRIGSSHFVGHKAHEDQPTTCIFACKHVDRQYTHCICADTLHEHVKAVA